MKFVRLEQDGMVQIVTISRPEALNALSSEVLSDLEEAFNSIDTDKIRCVVLTGDGDKSFVAGADISEMKDMASEEGEEFGLKGNNVFRMIEVFPIPVIAAIKGFALGGGNELAMSADIRICSETAVFGQPETGLGITPGFGGTQRLVRLIGSMSKAKELLYTARNIKADEALRIGLVSAVYPLEELMEQAMKMAKTIANNAPFAVRASKKAINEGIELDMDEAIKLEAKLFGKTFDTLDQKEGMTAFLEKRKEKKFQNK